MDGLGQMISASAFTDALGDRGYQFATGVPCSYFTGPIAEFTRRGRYLPAAHEGAALAIAAGACAAGTPTAVMVQNSGFGNLVNPLTSLVMPYHIPMLVFMSLRGWPDPADDEPQHAVMGATTHAQLDAIGIRHWTLDRAGFDLAAVLEPALNEVDAGRPAFVLVPKGAIGRVAAQSSPTYEASSQLLTRQQTIAEVVRHFENDFVVATTGYCSRELFAAGDRPNNFYMQGSMGHALSFALGISRHVNDQPVAVLDGDGALVMHLGTMVTVGAAAPHNLVHVVLNNGVYESTGGQSTGSDQVLFEDIARAVGYRTACTCTTSEELLKALLTARTNPGPHLVVAQTRVDAGEAPPRATNSVTAPEIYERLRRALQADITALN